jgi:precorrin-6Y C5,15-methyltransferase (decarboxylating)
MTPTTRPRITVVGIGADGWPTVHEAGSRTLLGAAVVLGGARHLAMLPDIPDQIREAWPSPLRDGLRDLLDKYDGRDIVALASGDPLVSGIGATLIDLLGEDAVRIEPAVSSVALARARMGWPSERIEVVSAVGRDPHAVLRSLSPGHRVLVLSSGASTPAEVAGLLRDSGYAATRMTVLGDLGTAEESRTEGLAATWDRDSPALNVIALDLDGPIVGPRTGGLPDEAFEHDGQLTKRDLRVSALARLAPQPGQLLWDVGAGAGSVGIEWMRAHPTSASIAVEADESRATRISENAARLGVPALRVVRGRAPAVLAGLPAPHAVFVGGGATAPGILDVCLAALQPGGRLVVHGVTIETEALLARRYARHGGELTRIRVEHAAPIGSFTGWVPARTVTQWALQKDTP